jgi:plastocyanin
MNRKVLWGIIIGVVIVGAAITFYAMSKSSNNSSSQQTTSDASKAAATITYSASGFSPSTTTVKSGDIVAIKNTSSSEIQFDSDPHPVHTDNTELNAGAVAAGQTVTFTVTTRGTFGFHNHLNPSDTGTITIQ